jgi:hypothetical protein
MYEVTLDFGDNAVQTPHTVSNLSELNDYLMSVPGMIGFEIFGRCTVKINRRYTEASTNHQATTLPGLSA